MPRPKKSAITLKPSALFRSCVKNLSCENASQLLSAKKDLAAARWQALSLNALELLARARLHTSMFCRPQKKERLRCSFELPSLMLLQVAQWSRKGLEVCREPHTTSIS